MHALADRHEAALTYPVGQEERGLTGIEDLSDVRTRISETEHHARIGEHLIDHREVLVEDRPVEDHLAVGGVNKIEIGLHRSGAGPLCIRGEAVLRSGVVTSATLRGEHEVLTSGFETTTAVAASNEIGAHSRVAQDGHSFGKGPAGDDLPAGAIVERGLVREREDHADRA